MPTSYESFFSFYIIFTKCILADFLLKNSAKMTESS